jgi:hypothetical protein
MHQLAWNGTSWKLVFLHVQYIHPSQTKLQQKEACTENEQATGHLFSNGCALGAPIIVAKIHQAQGRKWT